jgi:hypothetical protein
LRVLLPVPRQVAVQGIDHFIQAPDVEELCRPVPEVDTQAAGEAPAEQFAEVGAFPAHGPDLREMDLPGLPGERGVDGVGLKKQAVGHQGKCPADRPYGILFPIGAPGADGSVHAAQKAAHLQETSFERRSFLIPPPLTLFLQVRSTPPAND